MIKLYEADSAVEAYMVLNMIQQAGLVGRVDGEHLQSGIGKLQAFGLGSVHTNETITDEGYFLVQRGRSCVV